MICPIIVLVGCQVLTTDESHLVKLAELATNQGMKLIDTDTYKLVGFQIELEPRDSDMSTLNWDQVVSSVKIIESFLGGDAQICIIEGVK